MYTVSTHSNWPFAHYELPRLDKLSDNLYGASFFLMKLLPARFILQMAEQEGRIRSGSRIVETTSGTFGLALAMLSAVKGYKLTLISDPAIDDRLYNRLHDLGAAVEIMHQESATGGYQQVRLKRLHELLALDPEAFWPSQYENKGNPLAYGCVADYILQQLGQIDCLIGPVGSGGSMVGTSYFLRQLFPELHVIGVDTPYSMLFGQPNGPRLLRGLGNSIMPSNLDHTAFDEVSWIAAQVAFHATRRLHQSHGLYMGGTSGAAYAVAKWYAEQHPEQRVVAMFPDEGHRYADSIYSNEWLQKIVGPLGDLPDRPRRIDHPSEGLDGWSILHWNRRSLADVLNHQQLLNM